MAFTAWVVGFAGIGLHDRRRRPEAQSKRHVGHVLGQPLRTEQGGVSTMLLAPFLAKMMGMLTHSCDR